jgi:hypothetical protein
MIHSKKTILVTLSMLAATAPMVGPTSAQDSRIVLATDLRPTVRVVTQAERFALLEEQALTTPTEYDVLWQTAEAGTSLGAAQEDKGTRMAIVRHARGYAQQAKALRPHGIQGRYWLAVGSGLLADDEGGRTRIRLAEEAWTEATWVLQADSLHAGAHHLKGRIHAAVMRLNPITRFLARKLIGGDVLGRASWESAEHHLRTAAELAPGDAVNHLELGMACRDMDRHAEAVAAFRRAAATPPWRAADQRHITQATAMLAQMGVEGSP